MALLACAAASAGAVAGVAWRPLVEGGDAPPPAETTQKLLLEIGGAFAGVAFVVAIVAAYCPHIVEVDKLFLVGGCAAGSLLGALLGTLLLRNAGYGLQQAPKKKDLEEGAEAQAVKGCLRTRWGDQTGSDNSGSGRVVGLKDNFLLAKNTDESIQCELEFVPKEAGSSTYLVKTGGDKYLSQHFDLKVSTTEPNDAPERRMECKFYRKAASKTPESQLEVGVPYYIHATNAVEPTCWWSHKDAYVTLRSQHYAQPFHLEHA